MYKAFKGALTLVAVALSLSFWCCSEFEEFEEHDDSLVRTWIGKNSSGSSTSTSSSSSSSSSSSTTKTYTASYSGEGTSVFGTVKVKVTNKTIKSVTVDGTQVSANSDGTYTYSVDSEDGSTSAVYTITLVYDSSSGSCTYSYTSIETTNLEATTTQESIGSVVVKYNSSEGI